MEKEILKELHMSTREEAVKFLKSLWTEQPMPCPICGGTLDFQHKKAKKSNCDWKCLNCGYIFKTIKILDLLNEE